MMRINDVIKAMEDLGVHVDRTPPLHPRGKWYVIFIKTTPAGHGIRFTMSFYGSNPPVHEAKLDILGRKFGLSVDWYAQGP